MLKPHQTGDEEEPLATGPWGGPGFCCSWRENILRLIQTCSNDFKHTPLKQHETTTFLILSLPTSANIQRCLQDGFFLDEKLDSMGSGQKANVTSREGYF